MLLLLTNDDGIQAGGLIRLAAAASAFGEVWVVAPDSQRSAASHSLTIRGAIEIHPADFPVPGAHAFTCSGTPADCVRAGLLHILPARPDVVLSGVNFGYNAASDIQYSGTAAAAFEAEYLGVPAIALSEGTSEDHRLTDQYLPEMLRELIGRPLPRGQIWNVNFPQCAPEECRGILENRTVSGIPLYRERYQVVSELPDGGCCLQVHGIYQEKAPEGTDLRALLDRYVSVGTVSNHH